MLLRVEVTDDDIRHGVPADGASCPVARALKRCLILASREDWDIFHVGTDALVNDDEQPTVYLPAEVAAFIAAFDDGLPVAPLAFAIELPIEAMMDGDV